MSSNQQLTERENSVMEAFQLEAVQSQVKELLSGNEKRKSAFLQRMIKISTSYGMDKCTPISLINCGLQALTLDLPLEAGQGYLVNYGGQAQLDVGYKGWQVLAKRAGISTTADVVYDVDQFKMNGFGFDLSFDFQPDYSQRKSADDKWAKEHLIGVIVSVREDETGQIISKFVPADMIFKITAMAPSQASEKGKKFSPHENWAEQMFAAKAIKQVLSKQSIDLTTAAAANLVEAVRVVNDTESAAQAEAKPTGKEQYPQERFDENFPIWKKHVEAGKNAYAVITHLSNNYALTVAQMTKINELTSIKAAIDGEVVKPEKKEPPPAEPEPKKEEEKQPYKEPPPDGDDEAPY